MADLIQLRRDTKENWETNNPVLQLAEPGLETDTRKVKYGDGVTSWNNLPYASNLTPQQEIDLEESLKRVVKWTGTFDVGENFTFTIPNHTFTELREIVDAGNFIHISFTYQDIGAWDFVSKHSLFGYFFVTIDSTFHENHDDIGIYILVANAGDNDSIELSLHLYDSNNYYKKDEVDEEISDAVTPLEDSKLGFFVVDSLPSPWSAETNKLYLINDVDNRFYRGYFTNGTNWIPLGYLKPVDGIPSTDLASSVQALLDKADSAYQKPSTGIPANDMASAVQTSLAKADAAAPQADTYTKAETDALLNQKQGTLTFDTTPTTGSTNPVMSDGVKSYVDEYAENAAYLGSTEGSATADFDPVADTLHKGAQVLSASEQAQVRANINAQEKLVSGQNIATINGSRIDQGGNVTIVAAEGQTITIDAAPTAGSNNAVSSGGVVERYGELKENPIWIQAITDNDNRVLFGIKADGSIEWGVGVPTPVKDYIEDKIEELSLDEYEDIVNFIGDLITGDSLQTLLADKANTTDVADELSTKVDKVVGKSLINSDFADSNSFAEDTEGRIEIKLDSDEKILAYRDGDGVLHEEVGIETNKLSLSAAGMTAFQQALKDSGFQPGGAGNYSDKAEIQIPEPVLAFMNITNINAMPATKTTDGHAIVEVYDGHGNYFKKKAIINAQGNSSLGHAKKNFALDWCEDEWEGDDTPSIKIGKWVAQDSHHFKAYYYDFFDGIPVVGYQWFDEIVRTRGVRNDRNWKRALLPDDVTIGDTNAGMDGEDYNLLIDTGARCFPDGFPVIVHLNGEFYGIFCWQLKKHRDNYHQKKDNAKHVHLDGNICPTLLWSANGTIDWFKWAGLRAEADNVLNYDGIEIRNPKSMVMRDGSEYDQDYLKTLGSSATIEQVEPLGEDSPEYDDIVAAAEAMTDAKKRKKRLDAIAYTIDAKAYIISLTEVIPHLKGMVSSGSSGDDIRAYISEKFDVDALIDFQIFSDISCNIDGIKKNWQWNTWDGEKWACSPYDLDWTFGLQGNSADHLPLTHHLGYNDSSIPTYWIIQYFGSELNARYAELRRAKIVDAEHLASNLNEWTLRIGLDNYEKELERWPNRRSDNIYRFRNWCLESVVNMDNIYSFNN